MLGPVTCWSVPAETQVIASPKSLTQLLKKQGSQTASKLLLLILFHKILSGRGGPRICLSLTCYHVVFRARGDVLRYVWSPRRCVDSCGGETESIY